MSSKPSRRQDVCHGAGAPLRRVASHDTVSFVFYNKSYVSCRDNKTDVPNRLNLCRCKILPTDFYDINIETYYFVVSDVSCEIEFFNNIII